MSTLSVHPESSQAATVPSAGPSAQYAGGLSHTQESDWRSGDGFLWGPVLMVKKRSSVYAYFVIEYKDPRGVMVAFNR